MPKFREVSGQFVGYVPDGTDTDVNPDRETMNGRVTFTPVFTGGVIAYPELSPPEFAHPEPISARIIDGFVQVRVGTDDDVSMQPLSLMVTVDDEASQVWSWRAEFTNMRIGTGEVEVQIPAWSFRVPDGTGPVDLTELVPLKTSATVDVTKGPRGAGLENITAVDGQLVFEYTDGQETTVPVPEAVQGPQGEPGPAGADGEQGPEGPQGPAGEIPDLLVGNISDATPTGKNLMLAATEGAARNALGLQAGATSIAGSLDELNNGTQTNSRVWSPKNLSDYVKSSQSVSKGEGAPTIPVVGGGVYIDTLTGKQYLGVDKGPDPIVNMHTNPSNESPADNLDSAYVNIKNTTFKVVQLNLLYQDLNPDQPDIRWVDRKPRIANFINSELPGLMSVQENSALPSGTSLSEIMSLVDDRFESIEFPGANNGIIYDSETFEMEDLVKRVIPINQKFLTGGPQRSVVVARFRHKVMDQRVVFCSVHFVQDPAFVQGRRESVRICAEFLDEYVKGLADIPAVIIGGDFNESGEDFTDYFAQFGYSPSKLKATNVEWAGQGSYHGFDVNGNTSANWIDDTYSNDMLTAVDTRLSLETLPMAKTDMLSDHHAVVSTYKFAYSKVVQVIGSSGSVTTSSNTYQYFSTKWSRSGGGSLAIFPNNAGSSAAYIATLGNDSNNRIGWEVGETYTVSGYLYIPETLVGGSGWTRSITIGTVHAGESNNYSYAAAERAPNTPGVHRVSVTFTVPDKDGTFIRVMNGTPHDTVYWDDFMITKGSTLHDYFDGDSPGCYWEGASHYSRSVYPGPSWVEI